MKSRICKTKDKMPDIPIPKSLDITVDHLPKQSRASCDISQEDSDFTEECSRTLRSDSKKLV